MISGFESFFFFFFFFVFSSLYSVITPSVLDTISLVLYLNARS